MQAHWGNGEDGTGDGAAGAEERGGRGGLAVPAGASARDWLLVGGTELEEAWKHRLSRSWPGLPYRYRLSAS